jgi:HK97 family phage portal protein
MGLFDRFRNASANKGMTVQLITDNGAGFYSWNGKLYQSDIIRSAVRPFAKSVGSLVPKHIRKNESGLKINPEPYIRFLLEEPNPYMSMQVMLEKLANQFELNNNAFALIVRDEFGYASQIYPVFAQSAKSIHDKQGRHFYEFQFKNGSKLTALGTDIIHLGNDYFDDDVFGSHPGKALEPLMEIIVATDQSIVNAVRNSAVLKWLLKFKSVLPDEEIAKQIKKFTSNYLSINNDGGAASVDPRYELEQVKNDQFVPNTSQMKLATDRLYRYLNTNEKIVDSSASEEEKISYFESKVEPFARLCKAEFTRKIFSRRERGNGNEIVFEASSLQFATLKTMIELFGAVDRGMMTPDEWRERMNMAPIEGGDKPIRRLDTAVVTAQLTEGGDNNAE